MSATNDTTAGSVELLADCPGCRTEGAVVERYDPGHPACRFGVPATSRCRLCGHRQEGRVTRHGAVIKGDGASAGSCPACHARLSEAAVDSDRCPCGAVAELLTVAPGVIPADQRSLAARLGRWADEDGHDDVRVFLTATFAEPDLATILARLAAGEPVATLADPFALRSSGRGELSGAGDSGGDRSPEPRVRAPQTDLVPIPTRQDGDLLPARAVLYPLLSVLAADGEIHPAERALVDSFLVAEGLGPLSADECRMHRPEDVARAVPDERRATLLRLMCEVALADGLPDGNEVRTIHAFAAIWGLPHELVDGWLWESEKRKAPRGKALWLKVRRFVLVALWGVPAAEVDEHERKAALSKLS